MSDSLGYISNICLKMNEWEFLVFFCIYLRGFLQQRNWQKTTKCYPDKGLKSTGVNPTFQSTNKGLFKKTFTVPLKDFKEARNENVSIHEPRSSESWQTESILILGCWEPIRVEIREGISRFPLHSLQGEYWIRCGVWGEGGHSLDILRVELSLIIFFILSCFYLILSCLAYKIVLVLPLISFKGSDRLVR